MSDKDVLYPLRWRCVWCRQRWNGTGRKWGVTRDGHGSCWSGDMWLGSSVRCIHPPSPREANQPTEEERRAK